MKIERLENICSFLSGNAWSASKFCSSPPGIPIIRIQNLGDNENEKRIYWRDSFDEKYLVNDGDILLSLSGSIKLDQWKGGNALLNQRIVKIIPNRKIDKRYLLFKLSSLVNSITNSGRHALVNNVSINDVKDLEIPLPDLRTQQKIADILGLADTALQKRKQANALTEQFLQSAFLEMFGDPVRNEKGWEVKRLAEVVQKDKIITYGIVQAGPETKDGVPYIKSGDIKNNRIQVAKLSRTSHQIAAKYKRSEVSPGDIVMSIRATVGSAAIIPNNLTIANLTQGTARISPNSRIVDSSFMVHCINSESFQNYILSFVKGVTFREITLGQLRELEIITPQIPVQQKFATLVEQVERLRAKQSESERELENLFGSLMQKYFG